MDDLLSFFRACLDDEEQVAQRAKAMPYELPTDAPWERERIIAEQVGGDSPAVAVHRLVAIFANPDRVLTEIKAKRRILDYAETVHERAKTGPAPGDGAWFLAVRLLAEPLADRPGYREEWRP